MQFALNVAIFLLGFVLATAAAARSQKARKEFSKFSSSVSQAVNGEKGGLSLRSANEDDRFLDEKSPMNSGHENLLTKEQVESQYNMDDWQRMAYEEFKTTIMAKESGMKTFPCVYATMGYRAGDHRYVFLHSDDPSEPRNIRLIAPALRTYLRMSRTLGPNTSLVIMGAPTEGSKKTVDQYNKGFWEMLRGLRIWDTKAWPSDVPQETMNEKWTFCFDGVPLFPVALTPAHERRWSRHAPVPIIALQPKWVLDKLLATPEKRTSATGKVRKLLAEYDQTTISPDLTTYGDVGTSEVHQLCLADENEQVSCPYQDFDKASSSPAPSRRTSLDADA